MKVAKVFIVMLMVSACVSTHMAQFMGKDIREVIIQSGNPVNAFDMADGKRAFQFYWGGGTYAVPEQTNVTTTTNLIGSTAWTSTSAVTTGGYVVENKGCLITYLAEWSEQANGWIVVETRYPKDSWIC